MRRPGRSRRAWAECYGWQRRRLPAQVPLALVPCARASAPAPLPPDFFGLNLNRVLFDDHDPGHTVPLAAARAVGITRGRIDFPWGAVQPNGPDSADYRWTDAAVAALAAQGIQAAPMLGYSAGWAASSQGDDKTPPRRLSDYSHFATLMVRRYGPGGSFWQARPDLPYLPVGRWEVWNEPTFRGRSGRPAATPPCTGASTSRRGP